MRDHLFKDTTEYSLDDGNTWTVLQEIYASDYSHWARQARFDLSALVGMSGVRLAIRYSDTGTSALGMAIDWLRIRSLPLRDVELTRLDIPSYELVQTPVPIRGVVTNLGADALQTYTITVSDGAQTWSQTFSAANMPTLGETPFQMDMPFTPAETVAYTLTVEASQPNGLDDPLPADNARTTTLHGLSYKPQKIVLGEEATGTWCGFCPRGAVYLEKMLELYPDSFIGVAIHDDDPMDAPSWADGLVAFPLFEHGYPSVLLDRRRLLRANELDIYSPELPLSNTPVAPTIEAVLDVATKELQLDLSATFYTRYEQADFRLNAGITEDSVHGTGQGYNQVNYFSGSFTPMGGFENLPNPVPAEMMYYDHVARMLFGGWDGFPGSIAPAIEDGDTFTQTITYTLPEEWAPRHLHAVVMVIDQQSDAVLNANQTPLQILCPDNLGTTVQVTDESAPGAADGAIWLEPTLGFEPYTYAWSNGSQTDALLDLPAGDYSVTITDQAGCTDTIHATVGLVTALNEPNGLRLMQLAPNPATDHLTLELRLAQAQDFAAEICDAKGRPMWHATRTRTAGGSFSIDTHAWPAGVYFARVRTGEQVQTRRLIVMH